ncbi:MAG: OmpH family outer membrane protein, partial [Alistipes sp.]|nr:OmpH family outer membrane protein [Alistipes sp.]
MKKMVFTLALVLVSAAAMAQNYIVVNSEKIFKSIPAYNSAIEALDKLAQSYQEQVDAKFEEVERLYNSYQQQKASLSATTRQQWEEVILDKEKQATEYQEQLFGQEGQLMKNRIEKIKP